MANVLAPFGFQPVRRLDGAPWTNNMSVRKIASANTNKIYRGDAVKSLSTGYIDVAGATDSPVLGIFVGCKYLSTAFGYTRWSPYWPGADSAQDAEAYFIDDPLCVFLVQSGGISGSPLTITHVGANAKFTAATSGSTATGISGQALDDNTTAVTSTFPFRIIGVPGVDIANVGAAANGYDTATKYNVALVAFNSQDYKSLTGI